MHKYFTFLVISYIIEKGKAENNVILSRRGVLFQNQILAHLSYPRFAWTNLLVAKRITLFNHRQEAGEVLGVGNSKLLLPTLPGVCARR